MEIIQISNIIAIIFSFLAGATFMHWVASLLNDWAMKKIFFSITLIFALAVIGIRIFLPLKIELCLLFLIVGIVTYFFAHKARNHHWSDDYSNFYWTNVWGWDIRKMKNE